MKNSATQDSAASTAMVPGASLQEHAMQEITSIEAGLADLEAKYRDVVYDVTTTKGMEAAREARAAIRDPRYKLERVRAATSRELTTIQRAVNAEAKRITGRIETIEWPIHEQIKAEEDRIESERAARRQQEAYRQRQAQEQADAAARAEREEADKARRELEDRERAERQAEEQRQAEITTAIDAIRRQAFAKAATSADIFTLMATLDTDSVLLTSQTYGERVQEATAAITEALSTLGRRLDIANQEEQTEHLRQQAEQAELERLERERQLQAQREQVREQADADAIANATLRSAAEDALAILTVLAKPLHTNEIAAAMADVPLVARKLGYALDREAAGITATTGD